MDTMSKIYLSYFKSYTSRLMKIQVGFGGGEHTLGGGHDPFLALTPPIFTPQYEEVAEKDDLMGVEDTAKKDILLLAGKRGKKGWKKGAKRAPPGVFSPPVFFP